jgi:hypothetical protein
MPESIAPRVEHKSHVGLCLNVIAVKLGVRHVAGPSTSDEMDKIPIQTEDGAGASLPRTIL